MPRASIKDFVIAFIACSVILILFLILNASIRHWFIFPVLACGVIIGGDAIAWIRGRLDLFDPVGILGALGLHFFFLAPLLHVFWDEWMAYVQPLADWRVWLGYMAILNAVSLIIYQFILRYKIKSFSHTFNKPNYYKTIDYKKIAILLTILLPFTLFLQIVVFIKIGGISGMINVMSSRMSTYLGMGWLLMLSESFPILAAIGYICFIKSRNAIPKWKELILFLISFLLLQFIFGGLRGSRWLIIWNLFWVIGMIHLYIRSISKRHLFLITLFFVLFMYIYGFYKEAGGNMLYYLKSGVSYAEQSTKRTFKGVILEDLGRSDVQAYLLHNLTNTTQIQPAYGRTFVGAISILVPWQWWPNRPQGKVQEGTYALYGRGAWNYGFVASNIYGLGGEAMLNFGIWGIPLAYAIFGIFVAKIRRYFYSLPKDDGRLLLIPFWIIFCMLLLTHDSDNIVFFMINNGLLPIILVFGSLRKIYYTSSSTIPEET